MSSTLFLLPELKIYRSRLFAEWRIGPWRKRTLAFTREAFGSLLLNGTHCSRSNGAFDTNPKLYASGWYDSRV
jgi:hypothetical protein